MVLRRLLQRLASAAPVPVFAIAGAGARPVLDGLRLSGRVALQPAPRRANVLLVAGALPGALGPAALRAHDALSLPRATVWASPLPAPAALASAIPGLVVASPGEDLAGVIERVHLALLSGGRASDPPVLPDVPPAAWRGVGPYGQGGSGMTGGVPYGRPMAERADDRDGLMLDQLPVTVGPFFEPFPPGLAIDARFQGDVLQSAGEIVNPFEGEPAAAALGDEDAFARALREPVPIAELEIARARSHLRWLSHALRAHGLEAFAVRVLRLAGDLDPRRPGDVRRLAARLRWSQLTGWATRGAGRVSRADVEGLGAGPVARACGLAEDLRAEEPAYRDIGFQPLTRSAGDAAARCEQRVAEAAQALDLAARAGQRSLGPVERVEGPRGRLEAGSDPTSRLLPLVPRFLEGQEWGDAVATIVSLDLDLEGAAAAGRKRAEAV